MTAEVFDFMPKSRGDDSVSQIADFAEIKCLRHHRLKVSVSDVSIALEGERIAEDDGENGENQDEQKENASEKVWEAFNDVGARGSHCGARAFYPFCRFGGDGGQIAVKPVKPGDGGQKWHALLYLFLLWLTRTSANDCHVHRARKLFERLCCHVASSYWGRGVSEENAPFIHFGENDNFPAKIDNLAQELGEGGGFREEAKAGGRRPKDDGVDIIVHRPFADGRAGQLVGLGQCKSGHGYGRVQLSELQPDIFFRNWFQNPVSTSTAMAVRLFFLSDRIANTERMFQDGNRAGILFDRCRIMEHAANVDWELKGEIADWILHQLEESKILGRLAAVGIGRRSKAE